MMRITALGHQPGGYSGGCRCTHCVQIKSSAQAAYYERLKAGNALPVKPRNAPKTVKPTTHARPLKVTMSAKVTTASKVYEPLSSDACGHPTYPGNCLRHYPCQLHPDQDGAA